MGEAVAKGSSFHYDASLSFHYDASWLAAGESFVINEVRM